MSEHVYYVAVTFKLTEYSNDSASNYAISLNISPWKLLDDSEGYSYGQLVIGSFNTAMCPLTHHVLCRVFCEISNHPGDSASLQPRFGNLQLLAFPKPRIAFEREEISDHGWNSGKYNGAADGNWENGVRSQGDSFEGD